MTQFDEYQKFIRYKYGYHSFFILAGLVAINFIISLYSDFQWAETKELETVVFMFISVTYSIVMYIYHGAYFTKKQNAKIYAVLFFILGIWNIYLSFSPYSPLITNGKVTSNIMMVLLGILFLSIPLTYVIRTMIEKKREGEETIG